MSLNGNLEDLPLLDILQIVAFSQKTGFLSVAAPEGEATLVFRNGRIVASVSPGDPSLEARAASAPGDRKSALIREHIEMALERLTRLREGPFSFELTSETPERVGSRDLRGETLQDGLNPQELLLELARGIDEDRRDSVATVESAFIEADARAPETEAAPSEAIEEAPKEEPADSERHRILLLVEDEEDVRETLAGFFIEGGHQVVEAEDPGAALRKAKGLAEVGLPFVLVVDRGMPASDGSSFDGGFEVVKRFQDEGFQAPALLMTDRMNPTLQTRARRLGIARFVFKPGLSRLDPGQFHADLKAFAERLMLDVLPRLEDIAEGPGPTALPASTPLPHTVESWDDVAALQRRIEELRGPRDAVQVSALIMKAARDCFERALLFVVKDDQLRGLGGFGPAGGEEIRFSAREAKVPLSEPSAFRTAMEGGRAFTGALTNRDWNRITGALGDRRSHAVALLPLVTHRQTIALLFGDNPESGAGFPKLELLELFLKQAGVALENLFLKRRIEGRKHAGGDGR
jgi:CheY-like chemotaxis protein